MVKRLDKFALTNSIYNLDNVCVIYRKNLGGKPKFKKKNSLQSYQTNYTNNNIEVLDNYIKLPKLGKVKVKTHRTLEGRIIHATIKKYGDNKYKVMITVEKKIKKKGSDNYIKLSNKINKLYDKSNNVRKEFLHKLSTSIINENQVIVIEDLDVKSMNKSK